MSAAPGTEGLPPIPVTVVGGYLGAGKTTLVNALLRQAQGLRLAVLVNDFGALPIDADLIEAQEGNVVSIAGGCVCCSYGSDLIAALMQLADMRPRVDHVLIETSGVALPGQVASALTLLSGFVLDAVVTLVDAGHVQAQAADPYLADTITRQLADAHLVILNKCDLVEASAQAGLEQWIDAQAPQAGLVTAAHGAVPLAVVLGRGLGRPAASRGDGPHAHAHGHAHAHAHGREYVSRVLDVTAVTNVTALAAALQAPELALLRAKGIVRGPDGGSYVVQLAGRHTSITPARADQAPRGLVVIGLAGRADLAAAARAAQSLSL
jgi:G3E family GTPase